MSGVSYSLLNDYFELILAKSYFDSDYWGLMGDINSAPSLASYS
jgi:hypothetical protein